MKSRVKVANLPVPIDEVTGRHRWNANRADELLVSVIGDEEGRSEPTDEAVKGRRVLIDTDRDYDQALGSKVGINLRVGWKGCLAWRAPRGPKVHEDDLARGRGRDPG